PITAADLLNDQARRAAECAAKEQIVPDETTGIVRRQRAAVIEAKLSSASTISAASLVAWVPLIPMATPMSAFFKAGASFTPSPVIATIWLFAWIALTSRSLGSGLRAPR